MVIKIFNRYTEITSKFLFQVLKLDGFKCQEYQDYNPKGYFLRNQLSSFSARKQKTQVHFHSSCLTYVFQHRFSFQAISMHNSSYIYYKKLTSLKNDIII